MNIGIVVAMQKELDYLLKLVGKYKTEDVLGNKVYTFDNYPDIYVILSGVGELQSAFACSILITLYKVNRIINYGYVGSLCNDLKKGDIVNIESVIHCDMDLTLFGLKPGQYNESKIIEFTADSQYFNHLNLVKKKLSSSDQFLNPGEKRNNLITLFGENVSDMEGAGIALVCTKAHLPFSMLKCVSNDLNDTHKDYIKFAHNLLAACTKFIYESVFINRTK